MIEASCPTDLELILTYNQPRSAEHLSGCERCAEFVRIVRLIAMENDAIPQLQEADVERITKLVLALVSDDSS